jgi:peptidylamidoglycolate lyase
VLRRWGAGLFWMPHMITVDRNGSVWIADVGRHQVLKFTASGKLIMAVGKKMVPGSGQRELCKPTQVCGALPNWQGTVMRSKAHAC